MNDLLTRLIVWLNLLANALGRVLLAPLALTPGWLSTTVVAVVTGVGLLVVFKYTSNQAAIKRVKDDIKANLLALKLFKDNVRVTLRAQRAILFAALRLALLAMVPMLIMTVPVLLVLGQLSLWYQARPLEVGEDAVVTVRLADVGAESPQVRMEPLPGIEAAGPVPLRDRGEVCFRVRSSEPGQHRLIFHVGQDVGEKELAVGNGFMRVCALRPSWQMGDALLYPAEEPFRPNSPIRSIAVDYPSRASWTSGADTWVIYWFAVSMVAGFAFRRVLNVNL